MSKKRIFIGSFIDTKDLKIAYGNIKKEIGGGIKGRWVSFENLHITYKFLGNVEEEVIISIKNELADILDKNIQCSIVVKGIGAFPTIYTPNVVFLKVEDKNKTLENIYENVQSKLEKLGFEKDKKKFIPHITIKRPKDTDLKTFFKKVKQFENTVFTEINEIQVNVIESILAPKGAIYRKI